VTGAGAGGGPDLEGLQPSYTTVVHRALRWAGFIVLGLQVLAAVVRLRHGPDASDVVLSIIQLGSWSSWLCVLVVFPPAVTLDRQGLRFRTFLGHGRLVGWSRVREIRVQGRWQDASTVVLDGGKAERLVGMPAEHAQRLADVLTTGRAGGA